MLGLVVLIGCQSSPQSTAQVSPSEHRHPPQAVSISESKPDTMVLKVHGMSCPLCATNVDKQLLKVQGVESVNVDLGTGLVTLGVSPDRPPRQEDLARAITESGFTLVEQPR